MEEGIEIRKGLQKEVVFQISFFKFKSTYIYYALGTLFGSFIVTIFISSFLSTWISVLIGVILLVLVLSILLFYSSTYGETGFLKKLSDKNKPDQIRIVNNYKSMLLWKK